jgi:16S rRNA (cytidine1402-2'-O)-methyltransferase
MLEVLKGETLVCIATDLSLASESIHTQSVAAWRKTRHPIGKRPTVFLLLSG